MLTSYELVRQNIDKFESLALSVIFLDEAHKIKNPSSKITLAFHQFSCRVRFGLTGTAIQNGYEELFTLLDWTNKGSVGTLREWREKVSKPLAVGQSAKATEAERARGKVSALV